MTKKHDLLIKKWTPNFIFFSPHFNFLVILLKHKISWNKLINMICSRMQVTTGLEKKPDVQLLGDQYH